MNGNILLIMSVMTELCMGMSSHYVLLELNDFASACIKTFKHA